MVSLFLQLLSPIIYLEKDSSDPHKKPSQEANLSQIIKNYPFFVKEVINSALLCAFDFSWLFRSD